MKFTLTGWKVLAVIAALAFLIGVLVGCGPTSSGTKGTVVAHSATHTKPGGFTYKINVRTGYQKEKKLSVSSPVWTRCVVGTQYPACRKGY